MKYKNCFLIILVIIFSSSCSQKKVDIIDYSKNIFDIYYSNKNLQSRLDNKDYKNEINNKRLSRLDDSHIIVEEKDHIYLIAKEHKISVKRLIELNDLEPPYYLEIGQKLLVKDKDYKTYIVKDGDNLFYISKLFNMNINDLININNLKEPDMIYPGEILKITDQKIKNNKENNKRLSRLNDSHIIVKESDNIYLIAKEHKISVKRLIELNDLEPPYYLEIGQKLLVKDKDYKTYLVKDGDNLFYISRLFNMNITDLININNLKEPYMIYPGERLKVTDQKIKNNKEVILTKKDDIDLKSKSFLWPVRGEIISKFGYQKNGTYNDAIIIKSQGAEDILAIDNGVVAYIGDDIKDYAKLIIIQHRDKILSAYGYLNNVIVKLGDNIKKGDKIGTIGFNELNDDNQLYFGIRKGDKIIDPEIYLKN